MSGAVAAAEPQRAVRAALRLRKLAVTGSEDVSVLSIRRAGHRVEPGVRTRSQPVVGPPHDPHARCVDASGSLESHGIDLPDDREHLPATDRWRDPRGRPAAGAGGPRAPTGPATGWRARDRHRGLRRKDAGSRCATSAAAPSPSSGSSLCAPGDDSSVDELALMVQDLIDDAEVPITTVVAVGLTATGSILRCRERQRGSSTRGAVPAARMAARWPRAAAPDACPVHQRRHRCGAGRAVVRSDLLSGLRLRASRVGDRVRRHQPWSALYRGERPWRRHRAHAQP